MELASTPPAKPQVDRTTQVLRWLVGALVGLLVLGGGVIGYAYATSLPAIRQPAQDHYHFRLQIINGGQAVNFADAKYQTEYSKDMCSAKLTKSPFHFHDGVNQITHVHWRGMTGGLFLKNYGWNLIGGVPGKLGYMVDGLKFTPVEIHGAELPAPPAGAHYYIYTGDKSAYKARSWNDFLNLDLKKFFAGQTAAGFELPGVGVALAHGGVDDEAMETMAASSPSPSSTATPAAKSEAELTRLNDLIGNAVIFVQKDRPTTAQIQDRFNHLVPLPETACAG